MAHRGMKKLRQVEKIGLIVLCIVMLVGLGLGTGATCGGSGAGTADEVVGTFDIAGEKIEIDRYKLFEYGSYLSFQNHVLRSPPSWKFARNLFGQVDPAYQDYDADEKDLWAFIMLHQSAEKSGVLIPPGAVEAWIRRFPWFQTQEGKFSRDRYLEFIKNAGIWATPIEFERMLARYLAVEYFVGLYQPLLRPTSEQVYAQWKTRHKRHDIQYIVQEAAPLRGSIDVSSFEAAEVQEYYDRNDIRRKFLVPTKRTFEALYFAPGQLTDDEFAALKKLADEKELVYVGPDEARNYYYANQANYPIEPIREKSRKEWEAAHPELVPGEDGEPAPDGEDTDETGEDTDETGEDGDETGEDGDETGEDTDVPADVPAGDDDDDAPPTVDADDGDDDDPAAKDDESGEGKLGELWEDPGQMDVWARYEKYFQKQVERELYVRKLLKGVLAAERIDQAGLSTLAGTWGAKHLVVEEPIDQYETLDIGVIGGPELREALNRHGPADEGAYTEKVLANGTGDDRALFLYRVKAVVNEHYPDPGDVMPVEQLREIVASSLLLPYGDIEKMNARELMTKAYPDADLGAKQEFTVDGVLRQMLRQSKAEDLATERLATVREMVAQGQTFAGAAKEKGYELLTLDGVSEVTPVPPEILPTEGEPLSPAEKQKNLVNDRLRFLVKGWMPRSGRNLERIAGTPPDQFVEGNLADKDTDAAYLVFVASHSTPGPEEMPEVESREIWLEMVNRGQRSQLQSFFSWERMVDRFKLQADGMTDQKEQ